jgi:sulfur carrier protein
METITVQLNGKPQTQPATQTVQGLIAQLELGNQRYAVEINSTLVPRSTYPQHKLQANDHIEIVQAIGGG